jgi:hypothetical protein
MKKGWNNMTAYEQTVWYGEATKGAYNYTDLNRVESAVAELAVLFDLTLKTKTNWSMWDVPTTADMTRYLGNVAKIREHCSSVPNLPAIPSSMNKLTYKSANNIEKILTIAYQVADRVIRSGEIYSGEV